MFFQGCILGVTAIIGPLFSTYGLIPGEISTGVMCCIVFGVVGSMIQVRLLNKYKQYVLSLRILCIMVSGTFACFLWTAELGYEAYVVNFALVGFFILPVIPTSLRLATELTYPVMPALANGVMMSAGQSWAVLIIVLGGLMAGKYSDWVIGGLSISSLIAIFISFAVKQDLRQEAAEKKAGNQTEDESEKERL